MDNIYLIKPNIYFFVVCFFYWIIFISREYFIIRYQEVEYLRNRMSSFLPKDVQMIRQGTYGCIFKPGMNCRGEPEEEGYITKIQFDKDTTQNEYAIGVHLLNNNDSLTEFNSRFAPIVDSCPIDIGDIKKDYIAKCNLIQENSYQNTFFSNKIRYVGKYTLGDYFTVFFKKQKNPFFFLLFSTHIFIYWILCFF